MKGFKFLDSDSSLCYRLGWALVISHRASSGTSHYYETFVLKSDFMIHPQKLICSGGCKILSYSLI